MLKRMKGQDNDPCGRVELGWYGMGGVWHDMVESAKQSKTRNLGTPLLEVIPPTTLTPTITSTVTSTTIRVRAVCTHSPTTPTQQERAVDVQLTWIECCVRLCHHTVTYFEVISQRSLSHIALAFALQ
jgi:hypothetical protein